MCALCIVEELCENGANAELALGLVEELGRRASRCCRDLAAAALQHRRIATHRHSVRITGWSSPADSPASDGIDAFAPVVLEGQGARFTVNCGHYLKLCQVQLPCSKHGGNIYVRGTLDR